MSYRHLLSPTRIGTLELPNRIAMAPMGVELVEADGIVRQPTIDYYVERARGGVGLIISENTSAAYPRGANSAHEIAVSSDEYLPGLTRLAEAIHAHGSRIAIQLAHHGKVGRLDTQQGREILMPSMPTKAASAPTGPLDLSIEEMTLMAKAAGGGKPRIRVAEKDDIEELVELFADAAHRAQRAGFDAVEIHGAHGYIFSEFLSPAWNHRTDEYGGSVENRSRLLCDVLRACKARTGDDFPIWCRIDAKEFSTEGGIALEDAAVTARLAQKAGADAIHVSAYSNPLGAGFTEGPIVHHEGGFVSFAARIKQAVDVPVIVAGRISPERGDEVIAEGSADLISMGRPLLAEPALVSKLAEGRREEIRPCVYCYVCVAQPFFDQRVRCAVNPVVAEETQYADTLRQLAETRRKVVVVGGGPAGLEAASTAAQRGHEVVLFEKSAVLGGTWRFAALPYEPNETMLDWVLDRIERLPVEVRLGEEATPEKITALAPDVVIAAAGAVREASTIPGADLPHVWDGDDLREVLAGQGTTSKGRRVPLLPRLAIAIGRAIGLTSHPSRLRSASRLYMPLGRRVTVIGGGLVGSELADFCAARGREVTLLERGPVAALEMAHPRRWRVLHELREAGVRIVTNANPLAIEAAAVRFATQATPDAEAVQETVAADSVIIAEGLAPNPGPIEALRKTGLPIVPVGDVEGVGYLEGAIHSGFRAAMEI